MAFVGPVAGALVAGGVYYGFSNLIQTRTDQIRQDLRILSVRLSSNSTPVLVNAPPSAAARITHNPWSTHLQSRWNQEIAYLVTGIRDWDRRATEWGRKVLYGEPPQKSDA